MSSRTPTLDAAGALDTDVMLVASRSQARLLLSANLAVAGEVGLDAEQVRGVLAAIAPIVGTARIVSATTEIVSALAVAIEIAELEAEAEAEAEGPL